MAHVMVLDSVNEDIFVCGMCKTVFNCLQLFLNHKSLQCGKGLTEEKLSNIKELPSEIISAGNSVIENISTLPTTNKANKSHVVNDAQWENLSCAVCRKQFKKKKGLDAHIRTHYEKPYQCPICGRCFVQNSHLQRHVASHKVWPDGLTETTAKTSEVGLLSYSCPYCKLVLSNYIQFRAHLKNHLSVKKFKCVQGECMNFHDTVENLLHHVLSAHDTPIYMCHICSTSFNSLENIATHQQTHDGFGQNVSPIKQYKCSQCDATFRKPEKLSLHMLTENHKKVCIHCNKTFASDKRLRLHLQIHRKSKPFQCHICNTSFHMKKYLSTHMLKHGPRQFKCSICKFMFKRQDLLQRHMRIHQIKKMLICPFKETLNCKKEFSRSDKLKLHVKCHTKHVTSCTNTKKKSAQNYDDSSMLSDTKVKSNEHK